MAALHLNYTRTGRAEFDELHTTSRFDRVLQTPAYDQDGNRIGINAITFGSDQQTAAWFMYGLQRYADELDRPEFSRWAGLDRFAPREFGSASTKFYFVRATQTFMQANPTLTRGVFISQHPDYWPTANPAVANNVVLIPPQIVNLDPSVVSLAATLAQTFLHEHMHRADTFEFAPFALGAGREMVAGESNSHLDWSSGTVGPGNPHFTAWYDLMRNERFDRPIGAEFCDLNGNSTFDEARLIPWPQVQQGCFTSDECNDDSDCPQGTHTCEVRPIDGQSRCLETADSLRQRFPNIPGAYEKELFDSDNDGLPDWVDPRPGVLDIHDRIRVEERNFYQAITQEHPTIDCRDWSAPGPNFPEPLCEVD